jgi:hypothetical protein
MKDGFMNGLFSSQDSKFSLKTAFLVTAVPVLMIGVVIYSVWLLLVMNFSYFRSNGFPLDGQSLQDFTDYLLQSQIDYIPYVGLFIISVFFVGLFLAHITLRPFNQLIEMCHVLKESKGEKIRIVGLGKKKLLVKLGDFLCAYAEAKRNRGPISIPEDLVRLKGPAIDGVFYFQFFCIIMILLGVTVSSIYFFTTQLQEAIVQSAFTMLKAPKGMTTFISSQELVFDIIVLVPSVISLVSYFFIARMIITKVQGVTYAYVRDVCDVVRGNTMRRLSPRQEDPGKDAAHAVNEILDLIHPRPVKREDQKIPADAVLSPQGS